jgi:hypothetical protein
MLSRVNETLERSLAAFKVARFLRPEIRGTEKRVLVRCETSTGAVNYLSFACTRRASGALKWIDVYIFMSAEDFSQTLRRIVLPMILESKKGLLENLAAGDHAYFRHLLEFARIAELTQQGKNREALDALHALPAELQTDHYILFMKVRLAQGINNTEYLHAIEEWEKAEPQDPALLMASIDGDVLRKDYHAAIAKATLLDEHLGGDAYQEYLIAGLHHLAAEPAAARLSARHALAQEPGMLRAYDLLIVLALEAGNNADLVDLLQEIEMKFPGTDMAKAVATEPRYSGLRSSAVFAAWLNVRSLPGLPADPATRHP